VVSLGLGDLAGCGQPGLPYWAGSVQPRDWIWAPQMRPTWLGAAANASYTSVIVIEWEYATDLLYCQPKFTADICRVKNSSALKLTSGGLDFQSDAAMQLGRSLRL